MKKIIKVILIVVGAVLAVLVLAYGIVFFRIKFAISGFSPMETGKITDDISVVKDDFANVFIIYREYGDARQYVVIDCANKTSVVAEQMNILGINPDDVAAVLLTHTDGDHVGALSLFDKAQIYISKEEEQMINGKKSKFLWFGNSLPRTDYILLGDRQIFNIGNLKIQGILAPGHTSGMMAYLINDKYLFSGDILSLKDNKIAPIPAIFDMDTKQAAESRELIRNMPGFEYIFTAHWGYTSF